MSKGSGSGDGSGDGSAYGYGDCDCDGYGYGSCYKILTTKGKKMIGKYVLIRGDRSGIFVGKLEWEENTSVILTECRRLWYWDGAASPSQLAMDGVSKPDNCKFPCEISRIKILDVIEIIEMTEKAVESIKNVKVWNE